MLPKEYTDELAKLQDSVNPVSTDLVISRIEHESSVYVTALIKN